MSVIKFDANAINNTVRPKLKDSINNLEISTGIISSISIPSDFLYASTLKNLIQTLRQDKEQISDVYKWTIKIVDTFNKVEQKNRNAMNRILGSASKTKLNKIGSKTKKGKSVKNTFKKNSKIEIHNNMMKKANAKVATKYKVSKIQNIVENNIKNAKAGLIGGFKGIVNIKGKTAVENINLISKLAISAKTGINFVGTKIVSQNKFFFKDIFEKWIDIENTGAKVLADVASAGTSLVKGAGEVCESLFDALVILGAGAGSVLSGARDGVTYIWASIAGEKEDWESQTTQMWKDVMGFVTEDHVQNAYDSYFKNDLVGKWIDENAHESFKSNGIVSDVVSGIGYVGGIIVTTFATGGIAGVATGGGAVTSASTSTAILAVTSGLAGIGKYTGEYWEKVKNSSWEGITQLYNKGEISEEDYNWFKQIRELSDEEWDDIIGQYNQGNISDEDFELIKQIRNMSEDWKTFENATKGIGYGTANGVWEGIQWLVGGKLANWTVKSGSQAATSAVRVGVDTGFNSLDTPFRTALDTVAYNKNWTEAWNGQGGWTSVLLNTIIGLVSSGGSEALGATSKIKNVNKSSNTEMFTNPGASNLNDYNKKIKISELFDVMSKGNGDYGVNQGVFKNLCYYEDPYTHEVLSSLQYQNNYAYSGKQFIKRATQDYFDVKSAIMNRYNMSAKDVSMVMSALDTIGACSYASAANDIVGHFKDSPKIFEQIFGFPLYKKAANGEMQINSAELLADMYVTINHEVNGGKIITTQNGKNVVKLTRDQNGFTKLGSGDMQQYMMRYNGLDENLYNRYIKSKTSQLGFKTGLIHQYIGANANINDYTIKSIKEEVLRQMEYGNQISMYINRTNKPLNFIDLETNQIYVTTFNWNEGGAHAVHLTEVREDGFVVSSWGKKCLILYSDLKESGGFTTFYSQLLVNGK